MPRLIEVFPNWFNPDGGIFARINSMYPDTFPWLNQSLDLNYYGNHSGEKETSPIIDKFIEMNAENADPDVLTADQITNLARIIYSQYNEKWTKQYAVLLAQYNPIENYSMTEEEKPNITRTETPNIEHNRTTTAKSDYSVTTTTDTNSDVYGFNSNSPVPQAETNGGSTVTTQGDADKNVTTENERETGTRTQTETGNRTLTRSGNIGVTTSQQMIQSEIELWEWNFIETVFNDVDKVLTTPKYNLCGGIKCAKRWL